MTAVLLVLLLALLQLPAAGAGSGITLSIPALGIDTQVVTVRLAVFADGAVTWDVRRLGWNAGRLDGTANIGEMGNTVLAGHSELSRRRQGIFYHLGSVPIGSEILINVNGIDYRYSVVGIQNVDIWDMSVVSPTGDERITLITCDPSSYNAATGGYDRRLAVIAARVG
ncbi:MAG: sortase [Chloroflexi bacterium]|nr:sortase [Chloroflexota bacterium]